MNKKFLLVLISFIFFTSSSAFANDYLITSDRAGDIKLGMSYQEFMKRYPKAFQVNGACNSDELNGLGIRNYVLVSDNNCNKTKFIKKIEIYSPKFKTSKEGFKIGTNISDILKIYPKIQLRKDTLTQEEYFEINDKNLIIDLFVRKNNSKIFFDLLGTYDEFSPSESVAKSFNKNGKIHSIKIYLSDKKISTDNSNKKLITNSNDNLNKDINKNDSINKYSSINTNNSQKKFKSIILESNIRGTFTIGTPLSISPGLSVGANYFFNENFSAHLETSLFMGKGFSSYFIPVSVRFNNELFNLFSFYAGVGAYFVPGLSTGAFFETGINKQINNDYGFTLGIDYGLGLAPTSSGTLGLRGGLTRAL